MKLDTETLLKQRFWLLLILSVPLAFVGVFLLSSSVPAQIAKERKAVDDAFTKINNFVKSNPKSPEWVAQASKVAEEKDHQKTLVWKIASEEQANVMTWPENMEKKYHFRDGLFAKVVVASAKKEDAGPAAKDDGHKFHGVIKSANGYSITVSSGKKELTFVGGQDVKVTIGDQANPAFSSLQPGQHVVVTYEKGMYFGVDKLTDDETTDYIREYKSQIPPLIAMVEPVDNQGKGVVQFQSDPTASTNTWVWKGGNDLPPKDSKFLRYVADDWNRNEDISEEAWIAQEDLWIQREIFRMVREANDKVAIFSGNGGAEKEKAYVFTNPYWQLTCRLTSDNNLKIKLKNLQEQRQYLDNLVFQMKISPEGQPKPVQIKGMPLAPAGAEGGKDTLETVVTPSQLGGAPPRGIFGVRQGLTWRTAAVKRIDKIRIGSADADDCAMSHRRCAYVLKTRIEPKKDPNAPPPLPADPNAPPSSSGVPDVKSPNGLVLNRYYELTPQARRLPVAVVIIVDQQHMERVLTVFANSKLRFLTEQIVMNRYPGSLRPDVFDPNSALAAQGFAGRPARGVFGRGRDLGGPPPEDQESNIELTICGLVSLYERYPPRMASATMP
jgi:hypothetical protein